MTANTNLLIVLAVGLALLAISIGARVAWRRARTAATRPIVIARSAGSPLRTLLVSAVVVGVQWAVTASGPSPRLLLAVLAVPALFAGASIARLTSGPATVRNGRKEARR
jgi:hypothetical protein